MCVAYPPLHTGTSTGKVLVLEKLVIVEELQRHNNSTAVCAIQCTRDGQVAVADEGGLITMWKPNYQDKTTFGLKGWVLDGCSHLWGGGGGGGILERLVSDVTTSNCKLDSHFLAPSCHRTERLN